MLLSTAYLPNIQYISKLLTHPGAQIEVWDTYQKQSYRNRTIIYGANGKQDLVIPVKRPNGNRTLTRDVILDYDMPWHQTHWKAIASAYKNSPFFDIFEPELKPCYLKKGKYLLDWNFQLLDILFEMTATDIQYTKTSSYYTMKDSNSDFREFIHPKPRMHKKDTTFCPLPYFQVFAEKHGFIPNLSFIDLLFNEGPQAIYLCKKCTVVNSSV
jgi:hypothetical protein